MKLFLQADNNNFFFITVARWLSWARNWNYSNPWLSRARAYNVNQLERNNFYTDRTGPGYAHGTDASCEPCMSLPPCAHQPPNGDTHAPRQLPPLLLVVHHRPPHTLAAGCGCPDIQRSDICMYFCANMDIYIRIPFKCDVKWMYPCLFSKIILYPMPHPYSIKL